MYSFITVSIGRLLCLFIHNIQSEYVKGSPFSVIESDTLRPFHYDLYPRLSTYPQVVHPISSTDPNLFVRFDTFIVLVPET